MGYIMAIRNIICQPQGRHAELNRPASRQGSGPASLTAEHPHRGGAPRRRRRVAEQARRCPPFAAPLASLIGAPHCLSLPQRPGRPGLPVGDTPCTAIGAGVRQSARFKYPCAAKISFHRERAEDRGFDSRLDHHLFLSSVGAVEWPRSGQGIRLYGMRNTRSTEQRVNNSLHSPSRNSRKL